MPEHFYTKRGWYSHWREAMAFLFGAICFCDFIAFPVLNGVAAGLKWIPYTQWAPMTLQNGGMFYLAFAAILGVAAWQRPQQGQPPFPQPPPLPPLQTKQE